MVKVVYNAPNRAHHYGYARELHQAGMLKAFVSGFPRYSPRAPIPEMGTALRRVDQLQTLGIACMKLRLPGFFAAELGHWSKIQLDRGARQPLQGADIFLFYNGCGLKSARWFRRQAGITIVEAVNSHVLVQEQLMREEYHRLGLPWRPFHRRETSRRIAEVEEADYVLLPSTFVARSFLAQGIPARRLLRVPYPMQKIAGASTAVPKPPPKDDVFRVLYVGTISVRKGLRYLIEAFRQLKHPKKELWIVGPTTNASGLENLSLSEGVKFFGPLKGDDLQAVYLQATVFCLPSIEDGFGLVLNEALAYGLPVIATENTGIEDLLPDGKGGMVVPIRDANAIGDCLNRLAGDGHFLAAKRQEVLATAARLTDPSKTTTTLSATLMQTFHQHPAKANGST
jgi:glycosyltransferase involved in cell wall biosynthesis